MVIKQYPIYYDLITGIVLPYKVSITQGDTDSIQFVVTITNNGAPVDLSNITSTFTFQKEDGNVVVGRAEVNEENIVYTVGTQEIAYPGKVIATFELYGQNGERLSSSQFKFTVIEELGDDSPIESTTEYTILAQLIKDNIAIQTAEETRIKNENERITAEQERRTEYETLKNEMNSYITDIQDAIESSQTALDLANQASQIANNTIEDVTETINQMNEIIGDATNSIDTINALTQTVQQNESERVTAEQERIDNEEERIQNESNRISAEQTREANENERITQEDIRVINENSRITAENNRIAKETERQENEAERATKEIERINAENIRISNENDRISSEQDRVSAENTRIQNEIERINAETIREENETARINAEIIREENEAEREQLKIALEILKDSLESGNFGDMYKSVYDKNNNGIVDNAEKVNNHTVESDVPKNAVFTDTIYDDTVLSNRVSDLEANKVDKIEGKGLSANDYTDEEKEKLKNIEENAQVNVIEKIRVNGVEVTPVFKEVNIFVPDETEIIDNLTSTDATSALSAAQGKILKDLMDNHIDNEINTEEGVHGIRWFNDKLEFFDGSDWIEIETGGGGVPPSNVINPSIIVGNSQITIKWDDPEDTVVDGQLISTWAGTKLVRKAGSYPTNEKDGIVLVDNKVRGAYSSTGFVDSGLTNGVTYYYQLFPYSDQGAVNRNEANRLSGTPQSYKIYGVAIDLTNSNPETAVTYTDDAVGMTAGSSAWDSMAIFKDIKPCVLKNGVVQYYLDPNDFTKRVDGSAADITSGNDGDVMIEIPKTGFLISTVGNILTVKVTDDPNNPNFKYYAHSRATEGDRSKLYIGAYLGWESGGKLRSLSGKTPTASKTIGEFRTLAQANGSGYDLVSFYPLTLLQCLYLIRYKNLDSQTALGRGYVDGNSAATNTGGTNAKGMFFGETTGKQQMKFLGIEDFWGNLRWWIDGLYSDDSRNIKTAFQNFNDTGSGYTNRGQGATSDIGNYMSKPQGTSQTGFIAKEVSGSASTYFCDYAYLNASRLPYFGGNWNIGSHAGTFYLHVSYSASTSISDLGGRLMYL